MEISPDDLYEMIVNDTDCDKKELIELVDTYLYTTTEMIIEAVHKHTQSCLDKALCKRLSISLVKQLERVSDTEFISDLGKSYLVEIKDHLEKHN